MTSQILKDYYIKEILIFAKYTIKTMLPNPGSYVDDKKLIDILKVLQTLLANKPGSPKDILSEIVDYLNKELQNISHIAKDSLARLVHQNLGIELHRKFISPGELTRVDWENKKRKTKHLISFELCLGSRQTLPKTTFFSQLKEILQKQPNLLYKTNFEGITIFYALSQLYMVQELKQILINFRPDLKSNINGVNLLDYLIDSKIIHGIKDIVVELAQEQNIDLKEIASKKTAKQPQKNLGTENKNQSQQVIHGIRIKSKMSQEAPTQETTQNSLIQPIFQYFDPQNPNKLIPLNCGEGPQAQILSQLSDDQIYKNISIFYPNGKLTLKCTNGYFGGYLEENDSNKKIPIRLRYPKLPPPGKQARWQFIHIGKNQIHFVPPQLNLNNLKANRTTPIQLFGQDVVVYSEGLEVKFSDEINPQTSEFRVSSIGYFVWTPNWKRDCDTEMEEEDVGDQVTIGEINGDNNTMEKQLDDKVFWNLGHFKHFFKCQQQKYIIISPNHVYTKDHSCKDYFANFEKITIFKLVKDELDGKQMKFQKVTRVVNDPMIMQALEDRLKEINKAIFQGKMAYQITKNGEISTITIKKIANTEVIQAFLQYAIANVQMKLERETIAIQMTKKEAKDLVQKYKNQGNITIKQIPQSGDHQLIKIKARPEVLKEIQKQISQGQVKQQLSQAPLLRKIMTERPGFQKQYNIEIEFIDNQRFRVLGLAKEYSRFMKFLLDYKTKLYEDQKNEQIGIVIQAGPEDIHQYRERLKGFFNRGLTINTLQEANKYKVCFPKSLQTQVVYELRKAEQIIQRNKINMIKNSNQTYLLENVPHELITHILERVQKQIKNVPTNGLTVSYVTYTPSTSKLVINQATETTSAKFFQVLDNIKKSFASYRNIQGHIKKCRQKLIGMELYKIITKEPLKKNKERKIIFLIKDFYREILEKEIDQIIEEQSKKLDAEFIKHIQEKDLKSLFYQNKVSEIKTIFDNKNNSFDLFKALQEIKLAQVKKNFPQDLPHKTAEEYYKQIEKLTSPLFSTLTTDFKNNSLSISTISSAFESFQILSKTYFGLKLPIIKQLSKFKKVLDNNNLIILKTGTGSGKSTVVPPYLVGIGCQKVLVTQPRRLPCREIYRRIAEVYSKDIVGYRVAGQAENTQAKLIYITDGLFKELIYGDDTSLEKIDVIMLDQIHERTKSIDLILLLLRKVMMKYKNLKVILCSATVNTEIQNLFHQSIKRAEFSVEITRFPVKKHQIQEGTPILNKVSELYGTLNKGEQLLVFFPGVSEVEQATKIFTQLYKKNANSLFGNQNSKAQQQAIRNAQVFFSTSIAQTSLTFPNLRYVIDSRLSRIMCYDTKLQIMVSKQIASSKSSIKQRQGRLGRNCPGDYYYFVYDNPELQKPNDHEMTELDRVDLTPVIFELLMRYTNVNEVKSELLALKPHDQISFLNKWNYSIEALSYHGLLDHRKLQPNQTCKRNVMKFKNLNEMRLNIALYEGQSRGCYKKVAIACAFIMMGSNLVDILLQYIPKANQSRSGDIETIGNFLLGVADTINLHQIQKQEDILRELRKQARWQSVPWTPSLSRIIRQYRRFLIANPSGGMGSWVDVETCLLKGFKNKVYFNMSLLGGSKLLYDKIVFGKKYKYRQMSSVQYNINRNSILYQAKTQNEIPIFLGIFSTINPYGQCTVSFCQRMSTRNVEDIISVELTKPVFQFEGVQLFDDTAVFEKHYSEMIQSGEMEKIDKNYPQFNIRGEAGRVLKRVEAISQDLINPNPVKIDLRKMLDKAIQKRIADQKTNTKLRKVVSEDIVANFEKINFRELLQTIRFELDTYQGATLNTNKTELEVLNSRNTSIELLKGKLEAFFKWFVDCQIICTDERKLAPTQPKKSIIGDKVYQEITERVNQIVDPNIEHYKIKNMVNGKDRKLSPRVRRMIAACWFLVNFFDCTIKGGFVRDWIVNGEDIIPPGTDLKNLLQPNARNRFLEVADEMITPSDIDVELPNDRIFNPEQFTMEMSKLGISVAIEDDGWRKHLMFDYGKETGGFTADLIQPYCYICHDNYDFDVNVFYIEKDHLNQIGMKMPIVLRPLSRNGQLLAFNQITVNLESLIQTCRAKQMKQIKLDIYRYRIQKFTKRGWKIQPEFYEPVIYKTLKTNVQVTRDPVGYLNKVCPKWIQDMPGSTIDRLEILSNPFWDAAYRTAVHWIDSETKSGANDKLLFHGTKNDVVDFIKNYGFDSRYYNPNCMYGRGAYFADLARKSHDYTAPNGEGQRHMFIVRVALGKQEHLTQANSKKLGPSPGFHSILGTAGKVNEYIIERWDQAKPLLLITYH